MKIELKRIDEQFSLEARNDVGKTIVFDNPKSGGGNDNGFRPMQSLLAAFAACSSMDVISIMKKQRLEPFGLKVVVDGERETGKDANLWKSVHAHFIFSGNPPKEKAERAVRLSIERYCSVSKTLEAGGTIISYTIDVNE